VLLRRIDMARFVIHGRPIRLADWLRPTFNGRHNFPRGVVSLGGLAPSATLKVKVHLV